MGLKDQLLKLFAAEALFELITHTLKAAYAIVCYKILVIIVEWLFPGSEFVKNVDKLDSFVVYGVLIFVGLEILGYFGYHFYERLKSGFKVLILVA